MKKTFLIITVLGLFINTFGQSNDIEISADITGVTIYNSSVEIHYSKEVPLSKGKNTIVFTDLTSYMVENTLNLNTSSNDVEIITVSERINYIKELKEVNIKITNLEDSIKRIENEIGILKCKTEVLSREKSLLFKDEPIGGVSKGVSVSEIEKASTFFNKRYMELVTELYNISNTQTNLERNLVKYKNHLSESTSNSSKSCSEIVLNVNSTKTTKVTFNFKFLSPMGGWSPVYDCKYKGSEQPISFIFRANVFNSTGISWDNVLVTLSTASPTVGFDKPTLSAKTDIKRQSRPQNIEFKEIEVMNSIAEYNIKNKYTIPSDSKPYLIEIDSYEIKAEFHYLLIPSLDPFGFLIANVPDWNKYNLIPGTTNIYNKGSYMGKTFLNTYAENDTLNIYLGKDNSLLTTRKETTSSNDNNIIGNFYIDKSNVSLSIKNNTNETLSIQVLDQVPVFNDYEKVKFNLQNIEQAIYNKKEGLLTWNISIDKNENLMLDYSYEIKTPKNERGQSGSNLRKKFRTLSCPTF